MSRVLAVKTLVVASLILLAGCGGSGRYEVAGTVSYKGKPLESGQIRFDPMPGGGASAGATIVKGSYKVPAELGLLPGKYKVFITGIGGNPVATGVIPGGEPIADPIDPIPAKYNSATTLTYDVVAGKNAKDFLLD